MKTNVNQKIYRSLMPSMFRVSVAAVLLCGIADQCPAQDDQSEKKITPDPYYSTLRQSMTQDPIPSSTPQPVKRTGWEPPKTITKSTPALAAELHTANSVAEVWPSVARKTTKPVTRIDFSRLDYKPPQKANDTFLQSPALSVAESIAQPLKPSATNDPIGGVSAVAKAANEHKAQALTPIKAINKFTTTATQAPRNAKDLIKSAMAKSRSIIRQKEAGILKTPNVQAAITPIPNTSPPKAKPLTPRKDPSQFNMQKVSTKRRSVFPKVSTASAIDEKADSTVGEASKIAFAGDKDSYVQQAAYQPQLGERLKKMVEKGVSTNRQSARGSDTRVAEAETASGSVTRVADASHNYYDPNAIYTPQGEVYSQPIESEVVLPKQSYQAQEYQDHYYQGESFENSRVLALVGGHPVFVGDMMFEVNQILEKHMKGAPQSAKDAQKGKLMTRLLPKYVDQKMLYVSTLDQLPEEANIDDILKQAEKTFNDKALPDLMENSGVESVTKFDAILRSQGTSVRQMRRAWAKDQISKFFLQEKVEFNRQVTHLEMLDEYRSNYDQYAVKGKVRFEQIEIQPAKAGGRFAAKDKIEDIYDRLVHGGNFEAIAKKESHGFRAFKGGQYDWTGKGSLVNKEIDKSIFTLPQGKLSGVIETKTGFHVIRVIERVESHHTPFTEAQVEIKKQILEARRDEAFRSYIDQLKDKINVEYVNE